MVSIRSRRASGSGSAAGFGAGATVLCSFSFGAGSALAVLAAGISAVSSPLSFFLIRDGRGRELQTVNLSDDGVFGNVQAFSYFTGS